MRLFTAVDTPEGWKGEAAAAQQRLARFDADLRFVGREQLHVTARFLGEVAEEPAAELIRAIEALSVAPTEVALGSAGTFGPAARTAVVWLGVAIAEQAALALLESVDRAIEAAGLEPADQPWRPHLTLARVRRQVDAERRRELASAVADLPVPAANGAVIRAVSLYRSDLGNRAPHHKLLARSAVS